MQREQSLKLAAADSGGNSGGDELSVDTQKLKRAYNALSNNVSGDFQRAYSSSTKTNQTTAKEFSDWEIGSAVKTAQTEWERKGKEMMRRMASEASALRNAANGYDRSEEGNAEKFKRPPKDAENPLAGPGLLEKSPNPLIKPDRLPTDEYR